MRTTRAVAAAVTLLALTACGLIPERVQRDDPRLIPMLDARSRVDRTSRGFTPLRPDDPIRIEWGPRRNYDVMLHVGGRTTRTIAFRRTSSGYEWIGEQETFDGPNTYETPDGTFKEAITINFDTVPLAGFPLNTVAVMYHGNDPELREREVRNTLTLEYVRPWLKRWGY